MQHTLFVLVDLLGTFAFAVSGAAAAREKRLDLFGVYAIAYMTACGGGIVRDLCLGALPPVGISDWRYMASSASAATMTIWATPWIERLKQPVIFFDSLGLGFFAVVGAHKALSHGANIEGAIILGAVTAVGGGVLTRCAARSCPRDSRQGDLRDCGASSRGHPGRRGGQQLAHRRHAVVRCWRVPRPSTSWPCAIRGAFRWSAASEHGVRSSWNGDVRSAPSTRATLDSPDPPDRPSPRARPFA